MSSDNRIAVGLFVLAAVTFGWFFGGAGWNQDAHLDLTRALVERRTLHIDEYAANTGDVSRGVGRHTYINKPPGVSFLAAVPYAIVRPLHASPRATAWIVTALTCGICGALIAPVLYWYGRKRVGATPAWSLAVALVVVFGTIVFPYSTMLFAHVPAALFLLLAVTLVRERPFLAGLAAGGATACFYVCAVAIPILAIRSRRDAARFVAGVLPFALLLGLYHDLCFGSPFRTAVEASTPFTEKGLLFGVLRLPSLEALWGITLSPYRGLFFASPVLLLAIFAARKKDAAIAAITLAFFLVIASFNGWSGGWAFGPRYVLPIVPLLGIPLLAATRSRAFRAAFIVTALLSVTINFLAAAVDAMPSPQLANPVVRYLVPAFAKGRIPEETRAAFPWYGDTKVDKVALPRDAGNLGELFFGEGRRGSVVPIVLWMIGGSALLFVAARQLR